jgi:adenosylmethionine-8-amino-7-oxononanoate aminotransferase
VCGFLGGIALTDRYDAVAVTDTLIGRGFVVRPLRGNTLQLSPPFITTDDELALLVAAIDDTLADLEGR